MKLVGKKRLLANNYNQVIISEKEGEIVCKVKSKKDVKGNVVNSLSNELKDKSDSEQLLLIVNEFLRNNKIVNITDLKYLSNYNSSFIEVLTSNNRKLDIETSLNIECISEIVSNILLKYNIDRYNKIYNNINNINKIFILFENKSSGYTVITEKDKKNDNIVIKCAKINNKINENDTEFITNFIKELLCSCEGVADSFEILAHIKVNIGDKSIWFDATDKLILGVVMEIISNHNKEFKECKKKQLKLEGYYNEYGKNG